ncbi:quinone oxidoreductase [Betaproteobacteria bacterium]|nr:quinone oxidoreductase [Betaproteobacteria bacterium]
MLELRAEIDKTGSPDVIQLKPFTLESPGPGEVLVRHKAIGVNYTDVYYRNGTYPQASLPGKLGHEAAGCVEAIGQGVSNVKEGDRVVYVVASPGCYSTARVVSADVLLKIPHELDFETAAAMLLKGMTVSYLFKRVANLQPFHKVLFHAAAGGTGLIAMQWARMMDVEITGTVSSEEKKELAKNYGAANVINYARENFVEQIRDITKGRGVDIVFDSVGASTFYQSIQSLKKYGLMVSYGNASGKVSAFDLGLLSGHLFITRPTLWSYVATRKELEVTFGELLQLVMLNKIRIPIYQKKALQDVVALHKLMEERRTTGCSILTV